MSHAMGGQRMMKVARTCSSLEQAWGGAAGPGSRARTCDMQGRRLHRSRRTLTPGYGGGAGAGEGSLIQVGGGATLAARRTAEGGGLGGWGADQRPDGGVAQAEAVRDDICCTDIHFGGTCTKKKKPGRGQTGPLRVH